MRTRHTGCPHDLPDDFIDRGRDLGDTHIVRLSGPAHATLRHLAEQMGEPMTRALEKAIEAYQRQQFLDGLNADFAALSQGQEAWSDYRSELAAWDGTLGDGLE